MRQHHLKLTAAAALTALAAFSVQASEDTSWNPAADAAAITQTSPAPSGATLTPPMAAMPISATSTVPLTRADVINDFEQARHNGRLARGEAGATDEVLVRQAAHNHAESNRLTAMVQAQEFAAQQEAIAQAQALADAQWAQQTQTAPDAVGASPQTLGATGAPDVIGAEPAAAPGAVASPEALTLPADAGTSGQTPLPAWPAGQDLNTTPDLAPPPQSTPLEDGAPASTVPSDAAPEPVLEPAPQAEPSAQNGDLPAVVIMEGVTIEAVPVE